MPDQPTEQQVRDYLDLYMRTIAFPEFVRECFKTVVSDSVLLNTGDTEIFVEELQASENAVYLVPSVTIVEAGSFDCFQTAGIINSSANIAAGLQVSLLKRRIGLSPDVTNVILFLSNTYGAININYRVWRVTGLFGD